MTRHDQLHSHVTRERIMYEYIDAPLCAFLHDGIALCSLICVQYEIRCRGDNCRILLRSTRNQKNVVTAHLTNLVKTCLCARNCLTHHDGFYIRIRCEGYDLGYGGLHLRHEVVRISCGHDVLRSVGLQRTLCRTELLLTLGYGTG